MLISPGIVFNKVTVECIDSTNEPLLDDSNKVFAILGLIGQSIQVTIVGSFCELSVCDNRLGV